MQALDRLSYLASRNNVGNGRQSNQATHGEGERNSPIRSRLAENSPKKPLADTGVGRRADQQNAARQKLVSYFHLVLYCLSEASHRCRPKCVVMPEW